MIPLGVLGLERFGPGELLVVLLIVLLLFGAKKLPDLSRSLGRSLGEFKKGREEGEKLGSKRDAKGGSPADEAEEPSKPGDAGKGK